MSRDLLPLALSVGRPPLPGEDAQYARDVATRGLRDGVLKRDGMACRHCGFPARGAYMHIHHLDGDHDDADPGNVVAACAHCHLAAHLELAPPSARLAWLPELTQAEVSALSRALFVSTDACDWPNGPGFSCEIGARRILDALEDRVVEARERMGTDNPRILARALAGMRDLPHAERDGLLAGIRLLPLGAEGFPPRILPEKALLAWTEGGGPYAGVAW